MRSTARPRAKCDVYACRVRCRYRHPCAVPGQRRVYVQLPCVVLRFNGGAGETCSVLLLTRHDRDVDGSTRVYFAGEESPVTDEEGTK